MKNVLQVNNSAVDSIYKKPLYYTASRTKSRSAALGALCPPALIRQWAVKGRLAKVKACDRGHADERSWAKGGLSV